MYNTACETPSMHTLARSAWIVLWIVALVSSGCIIKGGNPNLDDQDVRLTILHTSDFHSRIIKYRFSPGLTDRNLGLDQDLAEEYGVGGIDRMAYVVARERALSQRVLHLDSGDEFQGAPIFNIWNGEPEVRAMSLLDVDAVVVGNHEFDSGAVNFAEQIEQHATFPFLAANYIFEDDAHPAANTLGRVTQPWAVFNVEGLRVGVIGLGNLSSLNSLPEQGNSLGIIPLETTYALQTAVDQIRPYTDLIIVLSHAGLDEDEAAAQEVDGIDVIMGGHLHIVLNPPNVIQDAAGRDVIVSHSGAFMKFMGRLDLVLRKPSDPDLAKKYGFEVVSHRYQVFPIDKRIDDEIDKPNKAPYELAAAQKVAEMRYMMEPYQIELNQILDLEKTIGCGTDDRLRRFGNSNGDSPLGNLVAEAMQQHEEVRADFGMTNSTGIRGDLLGRIYEDDARACFDDNGERIYSYSLEELYNVLPFDNTITTMFLSGSEVQELFDYVASRSASRGCQSQAQVSGVEATIVCGGDEHSEFPHADDIKIGGVPINTNGTYELATNNYIAGGGSGFDMLERNTTQKDTGIPMRDSVEEYFSRAGTVPCNVDNGAMPSCGGGLQVVGVEDGRLQMRF